MTFQHAVTTVRSLGIRYIWIDLLCIIQDSEEDWQTEAATMGKVYQHALLNVAATHGKNSHSGLFTSQDPQTSFAVFQMKGEETGGIEIVMTEDLTIPSGYWTDEVQQGTLNKRAWVQQERLLSPRIIHFAHKHMIWDCAQLHAWELAPKGSWKAIEGSVGATSALKTGLSPLTHLDLGDAWFSIIETYSRCKLTFKSDKLVAISGMAQILAARFGDQYLQGLWRTDLTAQLCWEAKGPREQTRIDQIPSWSSESLSNTPIQPSRWSGGRKEKGTGWDARTASMQIRIRCVCKSFTFTSNPVWNADFEAELIIQTWNEDTEDDLITRYGMGHELKAAHDTADLKSGEDLLVAIMYRGATEPEGC
ncbi:hypothetical protein PG994_003081 [Apiospora phragmitis]|uniref:Heterokaryon incompatibility domain-containing protein n=1 Tax=Apiospora phragmitis TaxID=2905665 RepID=A0ABR1W723_9PEZI